MHICHLFKLGKPLIGQHFHITSVSSFVQAQFWHDPIHEDEYRLGSAFLSDINQEIVSTLIELDV